jgi:hypothetical protein
VFYSLREANVRTVTFMGWQRATGGYEYLLRRFAREWAALPLEPERPFEGELVAHPEAHPDWPEVHRGARVWARWYGEVLAVVNETPLPQTVTLRGLPGGEATFPLPPWDWRLLWRPKSVISENVIR